VFNISCKEWAFKRVGNYGMLGEFSLKTYVQGTIKVSLVCNFFSYIIPRIFYEFVSSRVVSLSFLFLVGNGDLCLNIGCLDRNI